LRIYLSTSKVAGAPFGPGCCACHWHLRHSNVVAIRTNVDIPEPLYHRLRHRAESLGTSIGSLIVWAIEQVYTDAGEKEAVPGPLVCGSGKLGPRFPEDENPHDLIFS
jgi:hypothetical protein